MRMNSGSSVFVKEEWIDDDRNEVVYISSEEEAEDDVIEIVEDEELEEYDQAHSANIKEEVLADNNNSEENILKAVNDIIANMGEGFAESFTQNDNNTVVVPKGPKMRERTRKPKGPSKTMQDQWDDDSEDTLSGNEDVEDLGDKSWNPRQTNHMTDEDTTDENLHECHRCGFKFSKLNILNTHIKSSPSCANPFACNMCNARFKKAALLKSHIRSHIGQYSCNSCDFTSSNLPELKTHMSTHVEYLHECYICDKSFRKASGLAIHLKSHSRKRRLPSVGEELVSF